MVLQNRLDYGFGGYVVPATPRAARSARRSAFKKKGFDQEISRFDLLAAVAGNLLLEGGISSSSSNNAFDNGDRCAVTQSQTVREEARVGDDAHPRFSVSEILPESHKIQGFNRSLNPPKDPCLGSTSVITSSDSSERFGARDVTYGIKIQTVSPDGGYGIRSENNENESVVRCLNKKVKSLGDDAVPKNEHPRIPAYGDSIPQNPLLVDQDDVDLVNRENDDDDENSARVHVSGAMKSFRSTIRVGDRRIRKVLASKYCTISPKPTDTTLTNSNVDLKPGYCGKRNYFRSLRSERNYPIKKRRYFECFKSPKSEATVKKENHCDSPHKRTAGDNNRKNTPSAFSMSTSGQKPIIQSRDSHVRLRIKSFRVPELFIEIPETATVGSLKGMVSEAVNAILGGGLCIGVLVQGKRVRDDNKMLLQTGVSLDSLSDALGFCLEPNPSRSAKPFCPEDSNFLLPCNAPPQPLTRSRNEHRPSAPKAMSENSRALVPVPPLNAETITVNLPRKPKRCEVAQRRIRRPFSVAEVEALVQTVEKLGTGRWRDVKLQAFENAKHRTYVDLKDKWKTLVHTARISPQQRRGDPVPQELLERVLTAHAYWSQQQGKPHHHHHHQIPTQRLETRLVL